MESPTAVSGAGRSRRRRGLLRVVTCIGLLAILPIGWHAWNLAQCARDSRALERRIREKGQPLTLSDLAALYPPIPDDQNAAVPLLEIWEQEHPGFNAAFQGRKGILDPALPELLKPGEPVTSEILLEAETLLREHAAHLTAIRSAFQRPRARFPVRIEDGAAMSLPHLARIGAAAEWFRLKILIDTDRGRISDALDGLETMSRLSGLLNEEPNDTSQLVRLRILEQMIEGLKGVLSVHSLSPGDLDRARLLLEPIDSRSILKRWFAGAGVSGLSLFDPPDAVVDGADRAKFEIGMRMRGLAGLTLSDRRLMLEVIDRGGELMDLEYPELLSRATALQNEANEQVDRFPRKVFCAMAMPMIQRVAELTVKLEARARCASAALAVERYRLTHGTLPDNLTPVLESARATFVDPFDGEPIRFRRTESGYVVYSVGVDLRDDGGDPTARRAGMRYLDETFAVERPR